MFIFRKKRISDYSNFYKQKTPKNPWNSTNSRKNDEFYNFSLIFFFKFTRLLSIKNKYIYIFEKINQWLFKFLEAKNSQKSLKFYKFTKKRRVLQSFAYFFFQIYQIVKQGKLICLYFRKKNQGLFKFL